LYYLALKVVPLPTAIAIGFSAPLLTTIFAILILKEKTTKKRLISLGVGFLGVLLIVQPGLSGFQTGSLLVLAVVVIWCVIDIIIKRLGNSEKTLTQTFWITGIIALGSLPFAVLQWQPMTPQLWGFGLLIGLIFCVNTCAVFMSYRATDLTLVIPFRTLQLIFATILGAVFFNEYLDILTLVGSLVVLRSAFYLYKFKDEAELG
jgi:drug/metabolite transporter (DMT)-like permease